MRRKIDNVLGGLLAFLMAIMTIDVLWGVITRYAIGNQASWSEELARFLLIWIGILGAAYASGQEMHLSIDLLKPKLSPKNQKKLSIFIHLLVIFFSVAVLIVGGIRLIYITSHLGQLSAALRVPMSIVYTVIPLSGLLIVYYKVHDLVKLKHNIIID